MSREERLPGLLHFTLGPLTLVVGDISQRAVDDAEVGFAHVQEVRPHASHGHFGDVREGLTDGAAEDEHAHLLVQRRDVRVPHKRLGAFVEEVDPVALANDDRQDGDKNTGRAEHTVTNGVSAFGRVLDGLVVAVKPSAVRLHRAGFNDQERQAG